MQVDPRAMVAALRLAARRGYLGENAPRCLRCRNRQVQLVDWISPGMPRWKCRMCKHRFRFEPLIAR